MIAGLALAGGAATAATALEPVPPRVWYVDNTAPDGGDGSLVAPFHRLARAGRAADVGDTIYVFRGDGTSRGLDGGVRLRPQQRLIGSGVAFAAEGEEPLAAGEPPLLTASGPVVTLATENTVAGLALRATAGEPAVSGVDVDRVRLERLSIATAAGPAALRLTGSDDATLEELTVEAATGAGIVLVECAGLRLHHSRVTAGAPPAETAGVLVRDPAGRAEIVGLEVTVRDGRALAVESSAGTATVEIEGAELSGTDAAPPVTGLALATVGDAQLDVRVGSLALLNTGRRGIDAAAVHGSRLGLRVDGSGFVGGPKAVEGIVAHAGDQATVSLLLTGSDVEALDVGILATATAGGQLALTLADNVVPAVTRGRGIALLLADDARAGVLLARNELRGQPAEAIFVRTTARSVLALELRDNVVADAAVAGGSPLPSVRVESLDSSRVCATLGNNRIGEGAGGGPALSVRQRDSSAIAVFRADGSVPTTAEAIAADNRLGRVEWEPPPTPAAGDAPPCPPPAPQQSAPPEPATASGR